MIDTHSHLQLSPLSQDQQGTIERARQSGMEGCIVIGTTIDASASGLDLARQYHGIRACVGIHPEEAATLLANYSSEDEWLHSEPMQQLRVLASDVNVVGIGECGLDYLSFQDASPTKQRRIKELQAWLFRSQLRLAQEFSLPVSIHCRQERIALGADGAAYDDLRTELKTFYSNAPRPFVLHAASGPLSYIQECLSYGAYISFAGNLTYPSAHAIREIFDIVPSNRLLFETDAPFLPPQSHRGMVNEPSYILSTYAFAAERRQVSLEALRTTVRENAVTVFTPAISSTRFGEYVVE